MITTMSDRPDPWSRVHYRRLIAWPERTAREAPLLSGLLDVAPDRSLLDLGCGTGEHVAWAVFQGARAVGVDRSEAQIRQAREHPGTFLVADVEGLDLPDEPFGVAICLGNMLPHLLEDEDLDRFLAACSRHLRTGGRLLLQLLAIPSCDPSALLPALFEGGRGFDTGVGPANGSEFVKLSPQRADSSGGIFTALR